MNNKMITIPFLEINNDSIPQSFPILTKKAKLLFNRLRAQGIEASFWPGKEYPRNVDYKYFPISKMWMTNGLLLPIHESLNNKHLEKIATLL